MEHRYRPCRTTTRTTTNNNTLLVKHTRRGLKNMKNIQFNIIEQSSNDRIKKYEETYQEFKKHWMNNPRISKQEIFQKLGETYRSNGSLGKYINRRLREDQLPLHHRYGRGRTDGIKNRIEPDMYISRNRSGNYGIRKRIDNRYVSFGTYPTIEEARIKRDELIQNNWRREL